jgi:DNA invertase Pin-like site-specific DNA recombinase
MTIFGYARVSTGEQDCAIQIEELKKAGCTTIREEKKSGKSRDGRDELATLLEFVRRGDTLIVTKLDRLSRNTVDTLTLIKELGDKGINFKSLAEPWADTTSPAAEFMLTVFAGVAQFEREQIKQRQLKGIAKAKAAGVYAGKGRHRSVDREAIKRLKEEGRGPTEIAEKLGINRVTVYRVLEEAAKQASAA